MTTLPALTQDDLFEGADTSASSCGCAAKNLTIKAAGEKFEALAEPLAQAAEPLAASESPKTGSPVCMPWVRIERDVGRMRQCMKVAEKLGRIETSEPLYEIIRGQMEREDQEVYYVIALDTQLYLRGIAEIARGARDRVLTPIQDTVRYAIAFALYYGAMGIAIAHNHPSGKTKPSDADKDVTKAVQAACEANDLLFVDHIIVGINGYYSFRDGREHVMVPDQAPEQEPQRAAAEAPRRRRRR